jgi:hypothetical protein
MTRRIAYRFFVVTVLLLMLHGGAALFAAAQYLGGSVNVVWTTLANVLLHLMVVSGLLGGGLYAAVSTQSDNGLMDDRLLRWAFRLWMVGLIVSVLSTFRSLHLSFSFGVMTVVIVMVMAAIVRAPRHNLVTRVWLIGMGLSVIVQIISLFAPTLQTLMTSGTWNVAYLLAAVALGYWLIRRFSDVPQVWADGSLRAVSVLLTLAGAVVGAAPFLTNISPTAKTFFTVIAAIFYLIYAAHSYKPLSTRNATHTLAAHWYALAVVLLLFGLAFLGVVLAAGDVSRWTAGTHLNDAQRALTAWVIVALILGTINQAGAELRGRNWRITGLMPYWLVTFGAIGGGLMLGAAGLVQVYLEGLLGFDLSETQRLLFPVYTLWVMFSASVWLGTVIYAIGFWARRPSPEIFVEM